MGSRPPDALKLMLDKQINHVPLCDVSGGFAGVVSTNAVLRALAVFILTLIPFYLIWGRKLHATPEDRAQVMAFDTDQAITDPRLLKQSLAVIALVILGFMLAHVIGQEPATIAMFGAALLLLLRVWDQNGEDQSHEVQLGMRAHVGAASPPLTPLPLAGEDWDGGWARMRLR
jgi:di/tricarboxylate transporter